MQRRLSPTTTAAGINGDFADAAGSPNGTFLEDGVYKSRPNRGPLVDRNRQRGQPRRPALRPALDLAGLEPAARVGRNQPHARAERGHHLYAVVGRGHAAGDEDDRVDRDPLPASDRRRRAAGAGGAGERERRRHADPSERRGARRPRRAGIAARAGGGPGVNVNVRLVPHPPWTAPVENAIGGGPQLVRDGRPLFRAGEEFSTDVLSPREARAAVGQRRDGAIVMVAVDGDLGGYSVGMTNFELAQALVRLGCRTGAALEGGPATAMAFDGTLLSRPSAGAERPVSEGLFRPLPRRAGARSAAARALAEQGRDRRAPALPLQAPAGGGGRGAPDRPRRWDPLLGELHQGPRLVPAVLARHALDGSREPEGNWRWVVTALDEQGQSSTVERRFTLNTTLGFLRGSRAGASFRLARPAHVKVTLETRRGAVVRTLLSRQLGAGPGSARWTGRRLPRGRYVVRVVATNQLGRAELSANVR